MVVAGKGRADRADDGADLGQRLAQESPRTVQGDLAVSERQVEQRGDRAQKERDAQRLAAPSTSGARGSNAPPRRA